MRRAGARARPRLFPLPLGRPLEHRRLAAPLLKPRRPNLKPLPAQFFTIAYLMTTNLLLRHDGRNWRPRDWSSVGNKMFGRMVWDAKKRARQVLGSEA